MATAPYGNGLLVYGNIFHMNGKGSGISAAHGYDPAYCLMPDQGTNWIFNNIIYDFYISGFYTRDYSPKVQFRNNILVNGVVSSGLVNISQNTGSDYNVFWSKGAGSRWVLNDTNSVNALNVWKERSGQDAHSIYADPQFSSASPASVADFQLKSTSPCIDAGQDLRRVGVLALTQEYKDRLGTLIPQGLGADVGPYEVKTSAPAAPGNLRRSDQ